MFCHKFLLPLTALVLAGCDLPSVGAPDIAALREPDIRQLSLQAPPGAPPGSCWGKSVSPAVIETVTEQIIVQPAEVLADGTVLSPAIYKTETLQRIVRERRDTWFETPCPPVFDEEFIASLQRALKARGYYRGSVTGRMDARTRAAIRRYQAPQGLDTGILTLEAARQLGLVAVARQG
ncbi:peptidoglycan-binding domain-containing protein [Cognatishimia sp. SS12]|uniref:peptidoglycan-binding domain-containing protein n=1 Tax=Cognatishimia sp. SS12 TaxID=2979465 RepID=UPI00233070BB|nr:peptidoglycan-binding protein [Cognatishimia sp. SS12]MDC0738205.1 peptidoglycan-binding domain-containing protein [Cognatishimia sp. SS12]